MGQETCEYESASLYYAHVLVTSVCASSSSVSCLLRLFAPPLCVFFPHCIPLLTVFLARLPRLAFCHLLVQKVEGGVTESLLIIGFDLVQNQRGARFETLSDYD